VARWSLTIVEVAAIPSDALPVLPWVVEASAGL
jgi:hypothetical protein